VSPIKRTRSPERTSKGIAALAVVSNTRNKGASSRRIFMTREFWGYGVEFWGVDGRKGEVEIMKNKSP
jgi:hypothetical protein